jgi:hypothetical protein
VFHAGGNSLHWPGGDWALLVLVGAWFLLSRALVRAVPRLA